MKTLPIGRIVRTLVSRKIVNVEITGIGGIGNETYTLKNLATGRSLTRKREDLIVSEDDGILTVSSDEAREIFAPEIAASKSRLEENSIQGEPVDLTPYESAQPIPVPPVNHVTKEPPMTVAERIRAASPKATSAPHVIVVARAGTGKTTTLIEGLKRVKGIESTLTPSPQQAAVWEAMELSKGNARTICFAAFNKSIATELQNRVPAGCDAMTMHSMGLKAVTAGIGRLKIESYRVSNIISEILERDVRELRKNAMTLLKATEDLVGLCKMNLTDAVDIEELDRLASHYQVDLNGSRDKIFDLVPRVLEQCKDPQRDGSIDFDDMIWLPVVLNLPIFRYDLLLVDEAQDLNRCQQELAKRAGKRLILCGDPKQAIYGFAGADAESMRRMGRELEATQVGCVTLPLTVTRRCGKAIVKEAQRLVPDFEAFETNGEGKISYAAYDDACYEDGRSKGISVYHPMVADGDMVLCRVNAPLVSQCFRFLRAGRKAIIRGRDIGQGLISTVKKMKAGNVADLIGKLSDWLHAEVSKENAKRNPSEAKIIGLQDRFDCLSCFAESATTVDGVIAKIESVFSDNNGSGIILSSVHKSKGLEADRVFLLQPKGATIPHPMAKTAWQRDQEVNLLYVGVTRAKNELVYVS